MTVRVLTGITTTGTPHLGNYAGAIRPAIAASRAPGVESFFFLADYHALIKADDPRRVARSRLEIAATWLACGLDPEKVTFYRQSDIVEIPQLTWLLTCVAAKGLLNRAHAYKAAVDRNREAGEDPDFGVTAGLYMYPVLMAADILAFGAHKVPVGRDQIQHIEMARDIGQRFNHLYGDAWRAATGQAGEPLALPEAQIDESVATLPGLDGRKMSKSYDNTIPLFAAPAELKKLVMSIVTDSRAPGEAKDTEGSAVFQLYQAFATAHQAQEMRHAFAEGIGWGDAKQRLFARVDEAVAPMREQYAQLVARPARLEEILLEGARKAREVTVPLLDGLQRAAGLGAFAAPGATAGARPAVAAKLPQIKQYREADGRFHFKLVDAEGRVLLQGAGFDSPREAGQLIARLKREGADALHEMEQRAVGLAGERVGVLGEDAAGVAAIIDALRLMAEGQA
ncbi:tryptophan--tRNA ligase [Pseudoxanthomonas broegbernensis]|uniref:Tryptophan--tRNA ligase n=1 Tax=Pseudoxanthomonas broegbernensis TaxID=83619 RepID=A0A7V8GLP5_9GAMM|nr:tryptophan--tRNA ligase [Pseudoxanthomonas broegbernensis]KAF1685981.1 tryptophan--tRNA ligase [Pseudoxanthomonas broegbernensis]MBB6063765.1 tryptophanyl-tRNA synthetase [Pseudoxanthomonas broegbernensis]